MTGVLLISPVRNEETRISFMLESLLCQSYRNWTLLVADNSSSDGTAEIVDRYARLDSRIRLVRFDDTVPIHQNFMRAFSEAKFLPGDYIQILAGDDELGTSDYLSMAVNSIGATRFELVAGEIHHLSTHAQHRVDSFERLAKVYSSVVSDRFAAQNYWVCNLMYGFFERHAFYRLLSAEKYGFSSNLSSDWWFALGAIRELSLGFVEPLVYKKYSKLLSYDSEHYGVSSRRTIASLSPLLFPLRQLGDRIRLIPVTESLVWLSRFYLREIRGIFRAFNKGTKRFDS